MTFIPTVDCPIYPDHLRHSQPALLCPDMRDTEIDVILQYLIDTGLPEIALPLSQYGRRFVVEVYLASTRIPFRAYPFPPPARFRPHQPR